MYLVEAPTDPQLAGGLTVKKQIYERTVQRITNKLESMYYKLTNRADDRRKLLQTGESYHKLSGLVLEILKDLKDKYSESIQHQHLQTSHGFDEMNSAAINNFSSSDVIFRFIRTSIMIFRVWRIWTSKTLESCCLAIKKRKSGF